MLVIPQLQTSITCWCQQARSSWRQKYDQHWVLHSKKHPKFFEGVLVLEGNPPEIPIFSGFDPERLERGPQYSARRRNFQKIPRTFVVLRWGYNPSQRNDASLQYPRCPKQKQKTKKVPFSAILAAFSTRWLEHRGFQNEASFRWLILQSHRRTEIMRQLFWKFCLRAEI